MITDERYATCYMGKQHGLLLLERSTVRCGIYHTITNLGVLPRGHQVTPPQLMGFEKEAMEYQKLDTERCYYTCCWFSGF